MEIITKLKQLDEIKTDQANLEDLLKDIKLQIRNLEQEICTDAQNAMMHECVVQDDSGKNVKYTMSLEPRYFVAETNSDHSKKVDLYHRLIELTGRDDDFQFFETANVNAATLKSILKKLPHVIIEKFIADKLMHVELKPKIDKRKVK